MVKLFQICPYYEEMLLCFAWIPNAHINSCQHSHAHCKVYMQRHQPDSCATGGALHRIYGVWWEPQHWERSDKMVCKPTREQPGTVYAAFGHAQAGSRHVTCSTVFKDLAWNADLETLLQSFMSLFSSGFLLICDTEQVGWNDFGVDVSFSIRSSFLKLRSSGL